MAPGVNVLDSESVQPGLAKMHAPSGSAFAFELKFSALGTVQPRTLKTQSLGSNSSVALAS